MNNAHLRFGWLSYSKLTEKTSTHFKLRVDRFIGEVISDTRRAKAHLISAIGGDTQISAIAAAVALGDKFTIEGPQFDPIQVCLDRNAQCLKGSLQLAGRNKPLRHLVAISEEFATANGSPNNARAILAAGSPDFVWASLAQIHGLPGIPAWAEWFYRQLEKRRLITTALGVGCDPVLVKGTKEQFLAWIGRGVARGDLTFPAESGPVHWPHASLSQIFQYHQSDPALANG